MQAKTARVCLGPWGLLFFVSALSGCGGSGSPTPVPTPGHQSSRFLYVVDSIANTVSAFSINVANAGLTPVGPAVATADAPIYAAAAPNGKFLFVANAEIDSSSVSAYVIDQTTGALTPTTPATFSVHGDNQPLGIAVDATSTHVYTANLESISAFNIDPVTGVLSNVPGTPVYTGRANTQLQDVALTPDGRFVYATDEGNNLVWGYALNAAGIPVQPGVTVPAGSSPIGIAVDPAGKYVYVANWVSNDVSAYSITPRTGMLVPIGAPVSVGTGCEPQELAVDPSSKYLFVACFGLSTIAQFAIHPATGALTPVLPSFSPRPAAGPRGIAVDASGLFVYSAWNTQNRVGAAEIAPTGALTPISGAPSTGSGPIGVVVSGLQ